MTISDAMEEFLLYAGSVQGKADNTIAAYRNDLKCFIRLLNKARCTAERDDRKAKSEADEGDDDTAEGKAEDMPCGGLDIAAVTADEVRYTIRMLSRMGRCAASINRYIAAVRMLFAYCRKLGYIEVNITEQFRTLKESKRLPQFLTNDEVDELCLEPVKNELLWETRDRAILEMLYSSGCRVSELCSMRLEDVEGDASSAVIMGKGGKERRIYFEKDARKAFRAYMADRKRFFAEHGKEDNVKQVFINQRCTPLTRRSVYTIVARYSGEEGMHHHISPHTMRHTFATALVANGCDVRIVQELLGHASISKTQRYTHITTEQLIAVYNKAHPHSDGC